MCLLKNEPTSLSILQSKSGKDGGIGKPSANSAKQYAVWIRPETRRACLGQGEGRRNAAGGPNRLVVQHLRMS